MPQIGDLLASITGGPPSASPKPTSVLPQKRKSDDHVQSSSASKLQRNKLEQEKRLTPQTFNSDANRKSAYSGSARPSNDSRRVPNKSALGSGASRIVSNGGIVKPRPAGSQGRSAPASKADSVPVKQADGTTKILKRGSYAEIKARAAAVQAKGQQIGVINHKALQKGPSKKERLQMKAEQQRGPSKPGANGSKPGLDGARRPNGTSSLPNDKAGARQPVESPRKKPPTQSSYRGTARPIPKPKSSSSSTSLAGAPSKSLTMKPSQHGILGTSRPRHRDSEDEDMSDFIDYDEDEEEEVERPDADPRRFGHSYGRHRYREYSDSESEEEESEMEAGLDEIEGEEFTSSRVARDEDRREETLLEQKRREKLARRKEAMRAAGK